MPELNQTLLYVEASDDLPQACMLDSVKRLLEVYEVVEQITLSWYFEPSQPQRFTSGLTFSRKSQLQQSRATSIPN